MNYINVHTRLPAWSEQTHPFDTCLIPAPFMCYRLAMNNFIPRSSKCTTSQSRMTLAPLLS